MERVLAAGVAIEDRGPVYGSLRVTYFGERPLIEDNSARSEASTIWNARLGYRFANGLDLALEGFNLTDEEVSDIDYFFASRLPGEPAEGVEDFHFHPAEPCRVRLVLAWRFGAPRLGTRP
jgi:hypothetical protein